MKADEIEPEELCEALDDLAKAAGNSWVERCGAGEAECAGARGAIAGLLTFPGHPEVARTASSVIEKLCFNHEKNLKHIVEMSVPLPPLERMSTDKPAGYS